MLHRIAVFFSFVVLLLALFQNCDGARESYYGASGASYQAPPGLPAINYYSETPPPLICGSAGWAFLLRNYVTKNCGNCHYNGSFAPLAFGDSNLSLAYSQAVWLSKTQLQESTLHNKFCVPNCDILPTGEIYHGLMEWADNMTCP